MKKIMLIPLDERPCNYDFPQMLLRGTGYKLVIPPREILGKKKKPGNVDAIWKWFTDNIKSCEDAIISIDTLLYSGIVPSRLHYQSLESLMVKLARLGGILAANPNLNVYAFSLIMRNPTYSSSDEEPEYYGKWGAMIHRWGVLAHKHDLDIASTEETQELKDILIRLPQKYLTDYLERRAVNIEVNKKVVELAAEGLFAFTLFPQDDASPYGVTARDQQLIREKIQSLGVDLNVYMYPDADAAVNTLLARVINRLEGKKPLVYVKYASTLGEAVIPEYEDRIVGETIKYQILAAGGLVAPCTCEADIVMMVNVPSGKMQDRWTEIDTGATLPNAPQYDVNRTLVELVEYTDYAISILKKNVIFADIAYCNGGDPLLMRLLQQKGLIWKLAGYAGWNTSSNTIGTCLPMGMLYNIYGNTNAHRDFLALRYLEDIGYCSFVRRDIILNDLLALGLDSNKVDGPRGKVAKLVQDRLQRFAKEQLNDKNHKVKITDCFMPWSRMFEVGLRCSVEFLERQ